MTRLTARVLPPAEWPRLVGTLSDAAWRDLDPVSTVMLVVEDGGRIVGNVALFQRWHVEGAWIAPAYRRRIGVGRRLLRAVRAAIAGVGATEVLVMAVSDEGRRLCAGLGEALHLACDHFAVQVRTG